MNWLEKIVLYRMCNRSNVFLIETCDYKRLEQFIDFVVEKRGLAKKRNDSVYDYVNFIAFNLQERKFIDLKTGRQPVNVNVNLPPSQALGEIIRTEPTVVVIYWVASQSHADALSDSLLAWAHDRFVYHPISERSKPRNVPKLPSSVFVFTHTFEYFNENYRKQFAEVEVEISTAEERREVLKTIASMWTEKTKNFVSVTEDVVEASSGLTLHEVETACLESLIKYNKFTIEAFRDFKVKLLQRYGLRYIEPKRGFESVGGYSALKQYLYNRIIVPLRNPEIVRKYAEDLPRGLILYGYWGCGKTWLAKALAKELGLPMIEISASDFLRGIVGETERRIREITRLLESLAPVVVFIDEIDQLFLARGRVMITDSGVSRRLTNEMLKWLGDEDRKSFVIGATNFIEDMDPAALRPGRFDEVILVLPPDRKARSEILKIHFEVIRKPLVKINVDYSEIASLTYLWTGAELEKLVKETLSYCRIKNKNTVTTEDVKEVMKFFKINVEERSKRIREMISTARKLENVNKVFLNEVLKVFDEERKKHEERFETLW